MKKCEICTYWDNSDKDKKGMCRKNPPILDPHTGAGVFPRVDGGEWCGEWLKDVSKV